MEEQFGVKGTTCDGVFFAESDIGFGRRPGFAQVAISRQNTNPLQVKQRLAVEARSRGGNAVANFKYGQKAHARWELILTFKWDTESWYGSGDILDI